MDTNVLSISTFLMPFLFNNNISLINLYQLLKWKRTIVFEINFIDSFSLHPDLEFWKKKTHLFVHAYAEMWSFCFFLSLGDKSFFKVGASEMTTQPPLPHLIMESLVYASFVLVRSECLCFLKFKVSELSIFFFYWISI